MVKEAVMRGQFGKPLIARKFDSSMLVIKNRGAAALQQISGTDVPRLATRSASQSNSEGCGQNDAIEDDAEGVARGDEQRFNQGDLMSDENTVDEASL